MTIIKEESRAWVLSGASQLVAYLQRRTRHRPSSDCDFGFWLPVAALQKSQRKLRQRRTETGRFLDNAPPVIAFLADGGGAAASFL